MKAFEKDLTLGLLGGGQLGRMLIQSAIDYNIDVHVLDPDINAPCHQLATSFEVGSLTDESTVYNFCRQFDLISIEIENVNTDALFRLEKEGIKVFPQPAVIKLIQDKRAQKQFFKEHNIPTAAFVLTESQKDLVQYAHMFPAVHKLGREGYDGRGVMKIRHTADISKGFNAPGVLEEMVDFEKEISVIVARNEDGEIKSFPVVELVFHPEYNLVEYLFAPAQISVAIEEESQAIARKIILELNMVGLLAVEMFVTRDGKVLVNEVAPRTHNSGHQTIEANTTSQFEQHLRAIFNMPLGATDAVIPSAMVNMLGEDGYSGVAKYIGMEDILELDGVHVHFYGKKMTKPFRKMGHVTITGYDAEKLMEKVNFVKETLKVIA